MRTDILGVGYDSLTMDEAVGCALELMRERCGAYVVTPNPEIIMLSRELPELAGAIENASLVLADGIGVIHGAKILGKPLKAKLPGIDFAARLMEKMAQRGQSVFLFGSKPSVAEKAAENLLKRYPGLTVAGTHNGYFKDDKPIIDEINAASPDLLLVCLGAPKQELWMQANAKNLNVGLMAGLGGSLDVFAGNVRRAPETWQKLGLEWLYRLIKEPRRIKRMIKLPVFVFAVTGQRIRGK
ncbi:MAG: WecB/TagA/CpsF family glycosyltransferase [Oscillospiraceae bacterium]